MIEENNVLAIHVNKRGVRMTSHI